MRRREKRKDGGGSEGGKGREKNKKKGREKRRDQRKRERRKHSNCVVTDVRSLNVIVNKVRTGLTNSSCFAQTSPVISLGSPASWETL